MIDNVKELILDSQKIYKNQKGNYKWLKSTHKRLMILQKYFKKKSILVTNYESFEPDPQGYDGHVSSIDVMIELPPRLKDIFHCIKGYFGWWREFKKWPNIKDYLPWKFRSRWVFCIISIECFKADAKEDQSEFYYKISQHSKPFSQKLTKWFINDNHNSWGKWVDDNVKEILRKPIIEFDDVWTSEPYFTSGKDVIKYTKIWLARWYPELAKRKIVYVEQHNEIKSE